MIRKIKNGYWLLPALLGLSACFSVRDNAHFTYEKLPPPEYAERLQDSSDYYLIDVRTPGEYRKAHIGNAVNFSYLAFHFGRDVDTLSRDKLVFLYCHTCHRSPFAARIMKRKGFRKVYDLKGGYAKWAKAGQAQSRP